MLSFYFLSSFSPLLTKINSILELGAWVGVLVNGILADGLGRQQATVSGTIVFTIGVIVQACAKNVDYILGGRFVTGLGVGILSMIVPLYGWPASKILGLFIIHG